MQLEPAIAVVTNIENDHIASDADFPQLARAFAKFLGSCRRTARRSSASTTHGRDRGSRTTSGRES